MIPKLKNQASNAMKEKYRVEFNITLKGVTSLPVDPGVSLFATWKRGKKSGNTRHAFTSSSRSIQWNDNISITTTLVGDTKKLDPKSMHFTIKEAKGNKKSSTIATGHLNLSDQIEITTPKEIQIPLAVKNSNATVSLTAIWETKVLKIGRNKIANVIATKKGKDEKSDTKITELGKQPSGSSSENKVSFQPLVEKERKSLPPMLGAGKQRTSRIFGGTEFILDEVEDATEPTLSSDSEDELTASEIADDTDDFNPPSLKEKEKEKKKDKHASLTVLRSSSNSSLSNSITSDGNNNNNNSNSSGNLVALSNSLELQKEKDEDKEKEKEKNKEKKKKEKDSSTRESGEKKRSDKSHSSEGDRKKEKVTHDSTSDQSTTKEKKKDDHHRSSTHKSHKSSSKESKEMKELLDSSKLSNADNVEKDPSKELTNSKENNKDHKEHNNSKDSTSTREISNSANNNDNDSKESEVKKSDSKELKDSSNNSIHNSHGSGNKDNSNIKDSKGNDKEKEKEKEKDKEKKSRRETFDGILQDLIKVKKEKESKEEKTRRETLDVSGILKVRGGGPNKSDPTIVMSHSQPKNKRKVKHSVDTSDFSRDDFDISSRSEADSLVGGPQRLERSLSNSYDNSATDKDSKRKYPESPKRREVSFHPNVEIKDIPRMGSDSDIPSQYKNLQIQYMELQRKYQIKKRKLKEILLSTGGNNNNNNNLSLSNSGEVTKSPSLSDLPKLIEEEEEEDDEEEKLISVHTQQLGEYLGKVFLFILLMLFLGLF